MGENITKLLKKKKELVDKIGARISENNGFEHPARERHEDEDQSILHRKDIIGKWKVIVHTIHDEDYLSAFILQKFKGAEFKNGSYEAYYEFKDRVCLKSLFISGIAVLEREYAYQYTVKLTSTYSVSKNGKLSVILESGYLYYQLGDQKTVVKDFESSGREIKIDLKISGKEMVLEEKEDGDYKRLKKMVK
jgi:hypothetical protein